MSPFEKAFAAARKAGKKEFKFQGKSFNTKLKEETKSSRPKARPDTKSAADKAFPMGYKTKEKERGSAPAKKAGFFGKDSTGAGRRAMVAKAVGKPVDAEKGKARRKAVGAVAKKALYAGSAKANGRDMPRTGGKPKTKANR